MLLDTQLASVMDSLVFALETGAAATDRANPVDAAGNAFLDPTDGTPDPCYPYAWGVTETTLKHVLTQLHQIRSSLSV